MLCVLVSYISPGLRTMRACDTWHFVLVAACHDAPRIPSRNDVSALEPVGIAAAIVTHGRDPAERHPPREPRLRPPGEAPCTGAGPDAVYDVVAIRASTSLSRRRRRWQVTAMPHRDGRVPLLHTVPRSAAYSTRSTRRRSTRSRTTTRRPPSRSAMTRRALPVAARERQPTNRNLDHLPRPVVWTDAPRRLPTIARVRPALDVPIIRPRTSTAAAAVADFEHHPSSWTEIRAFGRNTSVLTDISGAGAVDAVARSSWPLTGTARRLQGPPTSRAVLPYAYPRRLTPADRQTR